MTLVSRFSCAHFYHQKTWTAEKNQEVFGKCFNPHGHGHDYRLEVSYFCDSPALENFEAIRRTSLNVLVEELDHKHLNYSIAEFSEMIPTTENLALYCLKRLRTLDPTVQITELRLFEREDLWVELSDL